MRRSAGLAWAVVACALLTLRAQEPTQQPAPTFRAGVDVVQLDVSVLDASRQPVKGLTAADFAVVEDGIVLPIVAFEAVDIPDASELPAPWMREAALDVVTNEAGARRIVVIVFDDAHMPLDATPTAMHIAGDVVDQLGPHDLGGVAFTDSGRYQNLTADRHLLKLAVDSVRPHPQFGGRGLPPCAYAGTLRSRYACVLNTLKIAGDALLQAPPGRKTLVFISAGVNLSFRMSDLRSEMPPWGEEMQSVQVALRALQQANVNVYAIDPSGLTPAGIMAPRIDSLRMFAEETGGRATVATNTPWEAVPQMFRENGSYYLLGVRARGEPDDGKFHKIRVTVDRPGMDVRTRMGYYTPSAGRADATPAAASPVDEAMNQPVPGGALPLGLTLAPFAVPGERDAALAVVTALREPLEPSSRSLELAVMALDARCGDCRDLPSERGRFTISASEPESWQAEVLSRMTLPPGRYEIRVAAGLDGRSGGVFAHVEVPDYRKDRISASGLVLSGGGGAATARADLMADLIPVVPTARREFRADAEVTAFLRIYQGGSRSPGSVRLTATILDAAGRTKLDRTSFLEGARFAGDRAEDYRLELPLASLESGGHLLTIEAHLGGDAIRRDARFDVR